MLVELGRLMESHKAKMNSKFLIAQKNITSSDMRKNSLNSRTFEHGLRKSMLGSFYQESHEKVF